MSIEEKIERINELYHLSKVRELSDLEKEEQNKLRREYIANVKNNLKSQLDNIRIVEEDNSLSRLKTKK